MAFVPAANCARVEMIYSSAGEVVENVFWVQKGSPFTLAQLQALRGTVNTWWTGSGHALSSSSISLTRIRTRAWDTASSPSEDYSLPSPAPGTQAGQLLPNNATFCFKLPTGHSGRSYRGRWYLVGITTAYLSPDANHINSITAANALTVLNGLQTALAAAGYTPVVVSLYTGHHVPRSAAVVTPALPYVYVDLNVDSMRRRLAGRGRP